MVTNDGRQTHRPPNASAAKRIGCQMIYVAMFDEGTAIFKCTDNPPNSNGTQFLGNENLPSDYYMRLVGQGGRMLRGEVPATVNPSEPQD